MRLDKYLKVSRIIKRRTIATEACNAGKISVNGKVAKASTGVKEGDVLDISLGKFSTKAKITKIQETTKKEDASDMYEILEGTEDTDQGE